MDDRQQKWSISYSDAAGYSLDDQGAMILFTEMAVSSTLLWRIQNGSG